jgi:hypothetical protein
MPSGIGWANTKKLPYKQLFYSLILDVGEKNRINFLFSEVLRAFFIVLTGGAWYIHKKIMVRARRDIYLFGKEYQVLGINQIGTLTVWSIG